MEDVAAVVDVDDDIVMVVAVVDIVTMMMAGEVEEKDESTDFESVVANAENDIDLATAVQNDLLVVQMVVLVVLVAGDALIEIFVEASSEEECWEVDYNYKEYIDALAACAGVAAPA